MVWIITKYLVTAAVVVLVSELGITVVCFAVFALALRRFGSKLL